MVGHCEDILRLGTAGILCGWALRGYFAVGHCRETWWLGTAGILSGWSLKSASSRARTTSTVKFSNAGIMYSTSPLLGWQGQAVPHRLLKRNTKLSRCRCCAVVLGLEYNLKKSRLGTVLMQNTQRRDDVSAKIQKCLATRFLSAKDGERLRGRLQFLDGQLFGKLAQCAYKSLSRHVALGGGRLFDHVCSQLFVTASHAGRAVAGHLEETLLVFFDASHEPGNQLPAGFGDILFGSNGRELSYFSELIDQDSLDRINKDASVNPIFELECFAILMALKPWHTRLCGCHAIIFSDNNGALGSMLKGHAENTVGSTIVHDCAAWFERVSSASNCSDAPSRGDISGRQGVRFSCFGGHL